MPSQTFQEQQTTSYLLLPSYIISNGTNRKSRKFEEIRWEKDDF